MIHILQAKVCTERKPYPRMVFTGFSDKKAVEKAYQLVVDDNPGNFVSLIVFENGVAVIHVNKVDELLATYVLSRAP